MSGGTGDDILVGDALVLEDSFGGADTFVFGPLCGLDVIIDFCSGITIS